MNDKNNAHNDELDCQVTVYDGAHNTCDMIEEASTGEETSTGEEASTAAETSQNDYHI